jgi:glucose-1-phosphate thymidylyltransferase
VKSTVISGYWKDTGNVADMLEVNRMVLEGLAGRQEGTVDAGTELIGRVAIGAGATVRGVRRIEASLIGHEVDVTPAPAVRRSHRLLLAGHSKVQISP